MKLVAAAAVLLALRAAPALAAELPADLAKAMKEYDQAQIHNDIPTLERLITDDFVLVNSDSTLQNKQEFLDDFRRPGFKIDPYILQQPVRKVLGDAAVVAGLMRLGWTQDGKHQTRRLRIAYVWAKRDGRWRVTYVQLTRVPERGGTN